MESISKKSDRATLPSVSTKIDKGVRPKAFHQTVEKHTSGNELLASTFSCVSSTSIHTLKVTSASTRKFCS